MKFLFKKYLLLIVCLIFLTGCTGIVNKIKKQEQPDVAVTEEETVAVGEVAGNAVSEIAEKVITCDDLKSQSKQETCLRQLNSIATNLLNTEILEAFDLARCDELPVGMIEGCKNSIEETGVQEPLTEEENAILQEAMRSSPTGRLIDEETGEETLEGGLDITKCAALTKTGLKEYCEGKVNEEIDRGRVFQIISEGDATKCDELTAEHLKRFCKMSLGVVEERVIEEGAIENDEEIETIVEPAI